MSRYSRLLPALSISVAVTLASLPLPAWAQTRCFQPVGGVPGAYSQPPRWWAAGAPLGSMTSRWIDDPRWQGASSFSHLSDYARARMLVETVGANRFLVVMWHVKADLSGANDRLYFGVWDDAAAKGNVFRIERLINASTGVDGLAYSGGAFNGRVYNKSGGGPWLLNNTGGLIVPPLPTWLKNDTRIDVFCPGVGPCDEWAVRMRIPIVPGADVTLDDPPGVNITAGGTFRFWYQIQDGSSLGSVLYGLPEGLTAGEEAASSTCTTIPPYCFPDPTTTWTTVQDGSTCAGDISIAPSGIYVGTAGNHTVSLSTANDFRARPVNNMSSAQPGNAIKATFRVANWGSVLFNSPEWLPICNDVVGTAGTITPTSQFNIACSWTVPDPCAYKPTGDACGPQAGSRHVDQCMLVDLASAAGGGGYFFSPQSAWQNMSFNGASTFRKDASINIRGLAPIPGGGPNRDLFVYVKVRNMPESVPPTAPIDPDKLDPRVREKLGNVQLPRQGAIDSKTAEQLRQALDDGRITYGDVEAIMPTAIAYVWHDTGKTLAASGGGGTRLLAPQASFGYFISHDGGLNGWRQRFEGMNVSQIGPNLYKLSVPENGSVTVTTTIKACEYPFCLDLQHWLLILLVLLVLLMLAYLLLRRKPATP